MVAVADEDVARLDVAMHEPGLVGGVERRRHLVEQRQRAGPRERAAGDERRERRAADELHRDEQPVVGLDGLVHGDDVRMLERGLHPALAAEATDELLAGAEARVEELQRRLTADRLVRGEIDGRHPAASEHAVDAVRPDHGAGGEIAHASATDPKKARRSATSPLDQACGEIARRHEAGLDRPPRKLGALLILRERLHVELGEQRSQVRLDARGRDDQLVGDRVVGGRGRDRARQQRPAQRHEHAALGLGEPGDRRRARRGGALVLRRLPGAEDERRRADAQDVAVDEPAATDERLGVHGAAVA